MNQGMRRLRIITAALWVLALTMFVSGWIADNEDLEHGALLVGMGAASMVVATAVRWGSQVLVHVMALYNEDLPTPEGTELIRSLVPPPRHATTTALRNVDGDGQL